MEMQSSDLLFYLDTELAGDYLIEVGIENAPGTEITSTLVTYVNPRRQIHLEGDEGIKRWITLQAKVY